MGYFRITIREKKKLHKGLREFTGDIDAAWRHFHKKAEDKYHSDMTFFEVVQLSKISDEVKRYLKRPKRPPIE